MLDRSWESAPGVVPAVGVVVWVCGGVGRKQCSAGRGEQRRSQRTLEREREKKKQLFSTDCKHFGSSCSIHFWLMLMIASCIVGSSPASRWATVVL